ncbi:MAG: Dephospho-CoA kinase CoaE [Candidatus Methanohalarchaeum thermophilum]|uniref:Dephospho-CoA kinase CoaE n=1 Tax=Methanohalarchaeum thermophilum TaxID=1903181 RepID=A0A1Q6DU28_METT1|nr:MAG: Dephospho-CoA kinase CoaE [Candidatus Methanohalarchaeum thermophilum]
MLRPDHQKLHIFLKLDTLLINKKRYGGKFELKVIGFIGRQASGKTTAAKALKNEGIPVYVMGDVVRERTKSRGLPLTEKNIGVVANELRKENGMDAIAKILIEKIGNSGSDIVAIDGIRGISEVKAFRKEYKRNFYSIAIIAEEETRFNRIKNRERSDDAVNWDRFREKEKRENSWGLNEAIDESDYKIRNENGKNRFKKRIKELVDEIND